MTPPPCNCAHIEERMKHFHGTPIGGTRQDAARFLLGRHALVPLAYCFEAAEGYAGGWNDCIKAITE